VRAEPQGPNEPTQPSHGQPKWCPSASCLTVAAGSRTVIVVGHSNSVFGSGMGGQGELVLQAQLPEPRSVKPSRKRDTSAGAGYVSEHPRGAHRQCHQRPPLCPTNVAPNISTRCPSEILYESKR
jgi:hypothetical protein